MLPTSSVMPSPFPSEPTSGADPLPGWGAIVVCGMPFDRTPPFSDTHLSRALAARRPVLAVDLGVPAHRAAHARPRLRQVADQLWRLRPVTLPGADRRFVASLSDLLVNRQIEAAAKAVLPVERLLVTLSPVRGTLAGVGRDALVYWRRDLATEARYVRSIELVAGRHDALLRSADLVTGVSPALVEDARRSSAHALWVPNGAAMGHFEPAAGPPPQRFAAGPVLGYVGAVSWRVDVDLIDAIARERPDWTIVLVGAVTVDPPSADNVIVVGERPYEELPRWTQRFDVGLIPYTDSPFNRASYPLKVFDYLASGTPVVGTNLPAIDGLGPAVRLAKDVPAFLAAAEDVLANPLSATECRQLARDNSWNERVAAIERAIAEAVRTKRL